MGVPVNEQLPTENSVKEFVKGLERNEPIVPFCHDLIPSSAKFGNSRLEKNEGLILKAFSMMILISLLFTSTLF